MIKLIFKIMEEESFKNEEIPEGEEIKRLMEEHDIDQDIAEKAQELINNEGLDEDEAIELAEEM